MSSLRHLLCKCTAISSPESTLPSAKYHKVKKNKITNRNTVLSERSCQNRAVFHVALYVPITPRGQNLNLDYTACRIMTYPTKDYLPRGNLNHVFFSYRKWRKHTHTSSKSFQSFFDNNQSLNQSDCDHFFFTKFWTNTTIFSKRLVLSVEDTFLRDKFCKP